MEAKLAEDHQLEFNFIQESLTLYIHIGNPTFHIWYLVLNAISNKMLGEILLGSNYYISRSDHWPENLDYILGWRGGINPINTNGDEPEVFISVPPTHIRSIFAGPHGNSALDIKHSIKETQAPVPAGSYRIRATALKIFGDKKIMKDWETWDSPLTKVIG